MATHTLATSGNLKAITYSESPSVLLPADLATIAQEILNDPNAFNGQSTARAMINGAFAYNGVLFIPNRGYLRVFPGDVVAVDSASSSPVGWPILVSADAIANGQWTFT